MKPVNNGRSCDFAMVNSEVFVRFLTQKSVVGDDPAITRILPEKIPNLDYDGTTYTNLIFDVAFSFRLETPRNPLGYFHKCLHLRFNAIVRQVNIFRTTEILEAWQPVDA